MYTTRATQFVKAPRNAVYSACLDGDAVAEWMVPRGMHSHVQRFEPYEGGKFRISLTYDAPTNAGKTSAQTDTFHGRFVELVHDEKIVRTIQFETDDPVMGGEMRVTISLADAPGGTEVTYVHEGVPDSVLPADNDYGTRMSLGKLAAYVEARAV